MREEMGIVSRERGVNSFKHFMAYKVKRLIIEPNKHAGKFNVK